MVTSFASFAPALLRRLRLSAPDNVSLTNFGSHLILDPVHVFLYPCGRNMILAKGEGLAFSDWGENMSGPRMTSKCMVKPSYHHGRNGIAAVLTRHSREGGSLLLACRLRPELRIRMYKNQSSKGAVMVVTVDPVVLEKFRSQELTQGFAFMAIRAGS